VGGAAAEARRRASQKRLIARPLVGESERPGAPRARPAPRHAPAPRLEPSEIPTRRSPAAPPAGARGAGGLTHESASKKRQVIFRGVRAQSPLARLFDRERLRGGPRARGPSSASCGTMLRAQVPVQRNARGAASARSAREGGVGGALRAAQRARGCIDLSRPYKSYALLRVLHDTRSTCDDEASARAPAPCRRARRRRRASSEARTRVLRSRRKCALARALRRGIVGGFERQLSALHRHCCPLCSLAPKLLVSPAEHARKRRAGAQDADAALALRAAASSRHAAAASGAGRRRRQEGARRCAR